YALRRRGRFRLAGDGIPRLPLLADRCACRAGPVGRGARALSGRPRAAQQLRPFGRGYSSPDWRPVGQLPSDLFHGRGDPQRHAAEPKLGGPLLARIFIISNRVGVPGSGNHPGGLEVALKATLRKHPCVWLGWSGEVHEKPRTHTINYRGNSYIVTDL